MTEASGKTFTINCTGNPDQNGFYQHSVFRTLADDKMVSSHDDDTTITVVMDHQQYIIPSSLGWRNGDNARLTISNYLEAGQFDVYVNDHKAGTFTANRKNTEKVLSTTRRLQQQLMIIFPSRSTRQHAGCRGFL